MQKILIVGPSLKMGGMERASANIANALEDEGKTVVFLSLFRQEKFFQLNDKIEIIEPDGFNTNQLNLLKSFRWIRSIVKHSNPDCVIVLNKFYAAITLFALAGTGFRVFISERSSPLFQWDKKLAVFNRIVFTLFKPTGVIAQTNIAAGYQKKYYGKNVPIQVIPNALRKIKHHNIQREPIILAVGRLNDSLKGFDRLLEAFALLECKDWTLVIAGGDQSEDKLLSKKVADTGLAERIEFKGQVSDIDELYARSSIFVIPSRSEGFPNALCEAMAAGLACISFDFIAGPRDIISSGENGIIVPNGDIKGLASAIDYLIRNKELGCLLGNNARSITSQLDEKNISNKIINFISIQ